MDPLDIFLAASQKSDPREREAFLDEACGADLLLRAGVESLMAKEASLSAVVIGSDVSGGTSADPTEVNPRGPAGRPHDSADPDGISPVATVTQPNSPSSAPPPDAVAEGNGGWAAAATAVPPPKASKARVRVVEGSAQGFSDEITSLLRDRLRTLTLIGAGTLALALATTIHFPWLGLRTGVLVMMVLLHLLLRSDRRLTLDQLRWVELTGLGIACAQALFMPDVLMLERAEAGDRATIIMDAYFIQGLWGSFILFYGVLIPNSWQRSLMVVAPLAILPHLNQFLLCWYEPRVQAAFDSLHHHAPLPITATAAVGAIYAAHALNTIRRQAFRVQQLGQYRMLEQLGAGGMGVVHRAEHSMLKRPCAIKLIKPGPDVDAHAVARFEREVQATARLSHPNTIEIYDYGRTDEGVFYYVMELLPGMTLSELVKRYGAMPPGRAVHLLRQVCGALAEAHGKGLIHRDVKPANIYASHRGGVYDVAKLLDFGLVKMAKGIPVDELTTRGAICGSPPYMSPEQASAGETVDGRTDVYSLGAVAYHLLTCQPPFLGRTSMDVLIAHARDPVAPPSSRNPHVPYDLEAVILRCLEKKPQNRYQDVQSLERALAACGCAMEWNSERAATWWRTQAATPWRTPLPPTSPSDASSATVLSGP